MQTNTLKPIHARIDKPRVGRGGKRGKTSGRGTKGQRARAGNSTRPEMRDKLKKIPKRRGFGKNRSRTVRPQVVYTAVNLSKLDKAFSAGDAVSPVSLMQKGLVGSKGGYILPVKILGTGEITKALTIEGCESSAGAKAAIEKAGGSFSA